MCDVSVIILTGREELHIRRCLEKLAPLEPKQIFVVESQKGDKTHDIAVETAKELGWTFAPSPSASHLGLVWHDWPGFQAAQFNWALDNLPLECQWILRLDADEYLSPDLAEEIKAFVDCPQRADGVRLRLERVWQGREIRHATNGIMQVRLFRRGKGCYLETLMDERFVVEGEIVDLKGAFYDASLILFEEWKNKQIAYAKREAQQALAGTTQDWRKRIYYLPVFAPIRPFAYFCIRYIVKLGFLDGKAGWSWNYWQGLWYRTQVEREIRGLKKLRRAV